LWPYHAPTTFVLFLSIRIFLAIFYSLSTRYFSFSCLFLFYAIMILFYVFYKLDKIYPQVMEELKAREAAKEKH
jgi:CHASE3 domain sensor protein